jgi:hypothetical protein
LIPIATVITPATLTVEIAAVEPAPFAMIRVPSIDFLSLNFANIPAPNGAVISYEYTSPKYAVDKIVTATAAQGVILPITAHAPNSSWTLDFPGPSLTCVNLEGTLLDTVIQNVNSSLEVDECQTSYGYIAWAPDETGDVPFAGENGTYTLRSGTLGSGNFQSGPISVSDVATIYIATFPGMMNQNVDYGCTDIDDQLSNAAVVQCALFNTSYHVAFSFVNGAQTVDITRGKNYFNAVVPV